MVNYTFDETNITMVNKYNSEKEQQVCMLNQTDKDKKLIAHNCWREDNPVNNPFAIDVIRLENKSLNVKGENKLETTAWWITYLMKLV